MESYLIHQLLILEILNQPIFVTTCKLNIPFSVYVIFAKIKTRETEPQDLSRQLLSMKRHQITPLHFSSHFYYS